MPIGAESTLVPRRAGKLQRLNLRRQDHRPQHRAAQQREAHVSLRPTPPTAPASRTKATGESSSRPTPNTKAPSTPNPTAAPAVTVAPGRRLHRQSRRRGRRTRAHRRLEEIRLHAEDRQRPSQHLQPPRPHRRQARNRSGSISSRSSRPPTTTAPTASAST